MPLTSTSRIATERQHSRIVDLWFALQPLRSTVRFMNTGAHPDDETSAMLAVLGLRDGINLSYACANRGEGGQNDIGTQSQAALGVLRTREMESACDVLNMRLYWLSQSPDDTIFDFGFSKSGVETLGKWGRGRTLQRFVACLRAEQPDIICPTFLNIPGQHGHHRAMTEAAHLVMDLAADPAYTDCPLPVWQVSKLYLPAWSGAGQAYDDDLPPPHATLVIAGKGRDPITGWSYERIAQQSRASHKTQGMGHWVPAGAERDWPLHLADSRVAGDDVSVTSGLPVDLRDWADLGAGKIAADLRAAQQGLDQTLAAFPDFAAVARVGAQTLGPVRAALAACTDPVLARRLQHKDQQLCRVIDLASGLELFALPRETWLRPGTGCDVKIEQDQGIADSLNLHWDLPKGWAVTDTALTIDDTAALTDGYRAVYDPLMPAAPALVADLSVGGVSVQTRRALSPTPVVLPSHSVAPVPDKALINLQGQARSVAIKLTDLHPADGQVSLDLPPGWTSQTTDDGLRLTVPQNVAAGLYAFPVRINERTAQTVDRIAFDHIAPTALIRPARVQVRVVDVALDAGKVGYIGGGHDRVAHWLAALGADVDLLSDDDLTATALARYDTVVIGIFAFRYRAALAGATEILHDWTRAGGNLVTLYHRPWDNWQPGATPPAPLEIGQPSLRWRVTDETADVTHLEPDHPILNVPNAIGTSDWAGWHKERGLYFAKSWDAAYVPLVSMADPDEAPHHGALLSARIGAGRHSHCALILHHQMEHLTEGAFRIMANLVAKA